MTRRSSRTSAERVARPLVARPNAWDRHPGALELGGGFFESYVIDGYFTDVTVSQP